MMPPSWGNWADRLFSQSIQTGITGLGLGWVGDRILVGIYFYSHYFFASTTAHITAMLAPSPPAWRWARRRCCWRCCWRSRPR
jgi:hypothetical protein